MSLEHRLSALLQLHLHSELNTGLQWTGQRQLQDETRNIVFRDWVRLILENWRYVVLVFMETQHALLLGNIITDRFMFQCPFDPRMCYPIKGV